MKIDRQALIFAAIILAVIGIVAGLAWFSSLFRTPEDGGARPVESFFSSLFPFGGTVRPPSPGATNDSVVPTGPTPTLRQVTARPASGAVFRGSELLRYVESETGHIFETPLDSYATTRISNTTIPGTFAVTWLPANAFVMQYFSTNGSIRSFLTSLASSTPDQVLTGRFVDGTTEIYPSTKAGEAFRVRKDESGTLVDRIAIQTGESQTLFSSSLRSWRVFPAGDSLFVATSPSSVDGYMYRVRSDQSLEKMLGNLPSLTVLPHPSGRYVAYSSRNDLFVLDTETARTYPAQVRAFADKCSWFPGDKPLLFCGVSSSSATPSLEAWYMGVQGFSDSAWVVDPIGASATIVSNLKLDAGRAIDVWGVEISPDGAYVAFRDKTDLSLWLLRLPK